MIAGVKNLCDIADAEIQNIAFGNKAVNLSKAMLAGLPVLHGFCVTFEVDSDIDVQLERFSNDIQKFYQKLRLEIGEKYPLFIVRSSFELEDAELLQFPGVFQSVHGVENFGQLLQAIKTCCKSLWSNVAKEYMHLHWQKYEYKYFTVMIQPEQSSEYSGVASSFVPWRDQSDDGMMLVQLTQGVNHKFVKGVGRFNSYTVFLREAERISYRQIRTQIKMDTEKERTLLHRLYDILTVLTNDFGADIGIEWGICQDELYIFQIRSICFQRNIEKHRGITFFCEDEEQGFKYQAMKYFYKNGLFPAKVLLFEKRVGMLEIKRDMEQLKRDMPITVRFSAQNEIGLPRYFAKKPEDALKYIFDTRQEQWSTMIYNSIQIQDSYELYMDCDSIILEHIPGIWESDSQLFTDTIFVKETQTDYWLAQNERRTKYEDEEGITWGSTGLFSRNDAEELLRKISPWVEKLRKDFAADLPLNFHFVSDSNDFYFLNCRVIGEIKGKCLIPDEIYTVSCVEDFKGWNGRSAILFEPNLERGEEIFLTEFVPFLRRLKVPVYVKFGILSHPAIMLREFGIEIQPLFLQHVHYIETRR